MLMSPRKKPDREKEEKAKEEEAAAEEMSAEQLAAALGLDVPDEEMRVVALYGDIDERKSRETLSGLLVLHHSGKSEDEDGKEVWEPMDMIISTYGGSADDMFALYDVMRMIQKDCEIHTFGLGKVMSAGVLLLAGEGMLLLLLRLLERPTVLPVPDSSFLLILCDGASLWFLLPIIDSFFVRPAPELYVDQASSIVFA